MVFQVGVIGLDGVLHLLNGVNDRRVVFIYFLTDIRGTKVGQIPDQIDRDLPGFRSTLVLQRTAQNGLVDGLDLADLADDQTGRGQDVALGLDHVGNRAHDIFQGQSHVV